MLLVTVLAKSDSPPALDAVSLVICPRLFPEGESVECATCGQEPAIKKCSKCRATQYCDRECQRLHWFVHKKECGRIPTVSAKEDEK
ncbi:Ankyrin repeat and MYND domain-containing protein 2 [Homalodisca vitripennis]|nr:Ankyrin repeat and MYND domain-containing protein 2 [Homalodisca vitripennis]